MVEQSDLVLSCRCSLIIGGKHNGIIGAPSPKVWYILAPLHPNSSLEGSASCRFGKDVGVVLFNVGTLASLFERWDQ